MHRFLLAAPLVVLACQAEPHVVDRVLMVEGMTCEACEHAIKRALTGLEGVETCTANAKDGKVELRYDENRVSDETLKATIVKLGYSVP